MTTFAILNIVLSGTVVAALAFGVLAATQTSPDLLLTARAGRPAHTR